MALIYELIYFSLALDFFVFGAGYVGDLFSSVGVGIRDRVRSPFWGAFAISWVVFNYRFFMVLFSGESVATKFLLIDSLYSSCEGMLFASVVPVVLGISYVTIWPRFDLIIFSVWARLQRLLIERRIEIDGETPIRGEEARRLRGRHDQLEVEHDIRISRYEKEKAQMQETVEGLRADLATASGRLKNWFNMGDRLATDEEIALALIGTPYRLYFNPERGKSGSKKITFLSDGNVDQGRNANENRWRIKDGALEMIQENGLVHSKFYFFNQKKLFINRPEDDTQTNYQQYMVADPDGEWL